MRMRNRSLRLVLTRVAVLACLITSLWAASPSRAERSQTFVPEAPQPGPEYTVNTPADPGDAVCSTESCSLRAAITAANSDGFGGEHEIDFSLATPMTITLSSPLPAVDVTLVIDGPGAETLAVSGGGQYRVFEVSMDGALYLDEIAVRNGYQDFNGAGIYNDHGTLVVTNSIIASTLSSNEGGGIFNAGGTAVISDTLFLDNHAFHHGAISNSGQMIIAGSLFLGNRARISGAIDNRGLLMVSHSAFVDNGATVSHGGAISNGGTLVVTNSTFAQNRSNIGGAISNGGSLDITNSTFFSNTADYGGSLVIEGGSVTLRNTLLATTPGGENCYLNGGTLAAGADNLANDGTCGSATVKTLEELAIGPLGDYGGPTPTISLLPGSAAIDAANDAVCTAPPGPPIYGAGGVDQRGVPRPQGLHCDVGAYERITGFLIYLPVIRN